MRTAVRIGLAASAAGLALAAAAPAAAQSGTCAALTGKTIGDHGTIQSATAVAADKGLPGFCEVKATLSPVAGSHIGVVYRLPENWNGKILGSGGGGWAGNVTLFGAQPGLMRGYATAQTDGGHPGTDVWNNDWAQNPEAAKDFAYRAIHEMTVAAKQVVQSYYGKPQTRTFYQGCSTGGRMGLMEAQRFPTDYDGIIAGAPVYTLQVQTSAMLRNQMFGAPGASFTLDQLKMVQTAALKACGGTAAGFLDNPMTCRFDPAVLACKGGEAGGQCLSPAQVTAMRTAYAGIRSKNGQWAAFPLERGGEGGWSRFVGTAGGPDMTKGGGMMGLKTQLFGDRAVDMNHLDADRDVPVARASAFADMYEAKDPNLDGFIAHGGKLVLWHGLSDPGPSPVGTVDYYQAVAKRNGRAAHQNVRLYLVPGTEHCGGGPGPNRPDTLTVLEQWDAQGTPPATLIAEGTGGMKRPICPFPAQTVYSGRGDVNDPKNYSCR